MTYLLRREQFIPRPREEVFSFFASAENLDFLTPPWLHFRILTPMPLPMSRATRIDYRIRWRWAPLRWTTEIAEWNPPYGFVDQQLRGPYALWHHTHRFEAIDGGTAMVDEVRYRLPLGPLGRLLHPLLVRRDLDAIFEFRAQRVAERFGSSPVPRSAQQLLAGFAGDKVKPTVSGGADGSSG